MIKLLIIGLGLYYLYTQVFTKKIESGDDNNTVVDVDYEEIED